MLRTPHIRDSLSRFAGFASRAATSGPIPFAGERDSARCFMFAKGRDILQSLLIAASRIRPGGKPSQYRMLNPDLPLEPLAQRRVWVAQAELALRMRTRRWLYRSSTGCWPRRPTGKSLDRGGMPYLSKLRGEVLVDLPAMAGGRSSAPGKGLATAQAQTTPRLYLADPCGIEVMLYQTQGPHMSIQYRSF